MSLTRPEFVLYYLPTVEVIHDEDAHPRIRPRKCEKVVIQSENSRVRTQY